MRGKWNEVNPAFSPNSSKATSSSTLCPNDHSTLHTTSFHVTSGRRLSICLWTPRGSRFSWSDFKVTGSKVKVKGDLLIKSYLLSTPTCQLSIIWMSNPLSSWDVHSKMYSDSVFTLDLIMFRPLPKKNSCGVLVLVKSTSLLFRWFGSAAGL